MPAIDELRKRLDAEFTSLKECAEQFQQSHLREYQDRERRFAEQFTPAVERLKEIWRPRLEALVERFKDVVKIDPVIEPHSRRVNLSFQSPLARVGLQFSVGHDTEVRNLVLVYDLEILPIYMEFEKHVELTMPLAAIDEAAVAKWLDDRIVGFVRTYLGLNTNQYYLKDHMVEDPVAKVKTPKYAAKATFDHEGRTYYFIGDETYQQGAITLVARFARVLAPGIAEKIGLTAARTPRFQPSCRLRIVGNRGIAQFHALLARLHPTSSSVARRESIRSRVMRVHSICEPSSDYGAFDSS